MSGHLSVDELGAVGLANSILNVLGVAIGIGLCLACDTFFSQAFGSEDKKRVGVFLQRSFVAMSLAYCLVSCVFLNVRPILPHLGQDLAVSEMCSLYLLLMMPFLAFDYMFLVLSRYLQVQGRVFPPLVSMVFANCVNAGSQYIAMNVLGFRYLASAVCQSLSIAVAFFCLASYIVVSKVYRSTWNGWTLKAFDNILPFFKIGIPGMLLVIIEFGSFEAGVLVMGSVSNIQMGAQIIILTFTTLAFMVNLGLSAAVTIRVGRQVGSGEKEGAFHSYKVGMFMCLVVSSVVIILYASLRTELPKLISDDADVIATAAEALKYYLFFPIVEAVAVLSGAALRGCGLQSVTALGSFVGYVLIGLPVGIPLSLLTNLGIGGLWIGWSAGVFVEAVFFTVFVFRINWDKQVARAQKRCELGSVESKEVIDTEFDDISVSASSKKPIKKLEKRNICLRLCIVCIVGSLLLASVISAILQEPLIDLEAYFNCTRHNCTGQVISDGFVMFSDDKLL